MRWSVLLVTLQFYFRILIRSSKRTNICTYNYNNKLNWYLLYKKEEALAALTIPFVQLYDRCRVDGQ